MQITPFDFSGKTVKIITDHDGNPWWVAADVCRCLGLSNPTEAIRALDAYEKSTLRLTEGGPKRNIINESGLYHLLTKSKKKLAEKFRRWNFGDVLPEIRKTGSYSPKPMTRIEMLEQLLEAEHKINRLEPKAKALDQITDTTTLKSLTEAAKVMSIKPKMFIQRLEISKILYRKKNRERTLLPYQYYIDYGWFEVKLVGYGDEKKYTQTKVTPKGIAKLRVCYNLN